MKKVSDTEFEKLKELYRSCFDADEKDAEEILGFARNYGEIHFIEDDNKIVSMLCLATLENGIKYLFAVATHLDYRNKGLFKKNLILSICREDNIICIPEDKSLFSIYEKLGFTGYGSILRVRTDGDGSLLDRKNDNADFQKLYEIYVKSPLYPHKPKELFYSTVKYHILYGGTVITDGSFYALVSGDNITELCVPAEDDKKLPELIKKLSNGKNTITLPVCYIPFLKENGIHFKRKKIFALKSDVIDTNDFYINTLYN